MSNIPHTDVASEVTNYLVSLLSKNQEFISLTGGRLYQGVAEGAPSRPYCVILNPSTEVDDEVCFLTFNVEFEFICYADDSAKARKVMDVVIGQFLSIAHKRLPSGADLTNTYTEGTRVSVDEVKSSWYGSVDFRALAMKGKS